MSFVRLQHVHKHYRLGEIDVPALSDITLDLASGRFTVLSGSSGSGKTTLLNVIGCLDRPDRGELTVMNAAVLHLSEDALADFRARHIGFIFQNFNLIPVLSAFENIEYPLRLTGVSAAVRRRRVRHLLEAVGLADRADNVPGQLSGGQRQRVAVARALATAPALVMADEPTANLDSQTGASILALMRQMQQEMQVSFVFSSHDPDVLAAADDAVFICDGRVTRTQQCTPHQAHPDRLGQGRAA